MSWQLDDSSLDVLIELERHEADIRKGGFREGLEGLAYVALGYAALDLRGYDTSPKDRRKLISESIQPMLEYHWGDWWKPEKIAISCKNRGLSEVDTKIELQVAEHYDPDGALRMPLDREGLGSFILGCLFAMQDDALKSVCSWYDARIPIGYHGGSIDELHQRCLLLIAAYLAENSKRIQEQEDAISGIKRKPLKMSVALEQLTRAVLEEKPQQYDELLRESLTLRIKRWEYMSIMDLIALEESILVELASRKGWPLPKLSKRHKEFILTKEEVVGSGH